MRQDLEQEEKMFNMFMREENVLENENMLGLLREIDIIKEKNTSQKNYLNTLKVGPGKSKEV